MAKYVFFVPPAHGHVNPTLGVAAELVDRGEDVVYVAAEQFRTAIEFTGARLQAHPDPTPVDPMVTGPAGLFKILADAGRSILPWLPEWLATENPDVVFADPMAVWGHREADRQGIPVSNSYVTYLPGTLFFSGSSDGPRMREFSKQLFESALYAEFAEIFGRTEGHPFAAFSRDDQTGISYMPRSFHPGGDTIGEEIAFTGPAIRPRAYDGDFPLEKLEDGKTLLISLGTVFNNQTAFFRSCFEAFADEPRTVVLSHGTRLDPADLGPAPKNFVLAPSVPQLPVLERTDIFITHGGMNSTMEGLWHGVPLIVVPQMPEQGMTANRVDELGLGVALDSATVTAQDLVNAVDKAPSFTENVADMHKDVHNAGGAARAADVLMNRG
jgi:MGT family glycosyltransferase